MDPKANLNPAFHRILLKISGEALMGEKSFGIDVKIARAVADEIKQVYELGVQVAVVVGGGKKTERSA